MKTENINGFIWAVLDKEEARYYFDETDLYYLNSDGSETLMEVDYYQLDYALSTNEKLGIEIGAEKELKADYHETVERNKENRSFEDWCLSKIE